MLYEKHPVKVMIDLHFVFRVCTKGGGRCRRCIHHRKLQHRQFLVHLSLVTLVDLLYMCPYSLQESSFALRHCTLRLPVLYSVISSRNEDDKDVCI